MLIKSGVSLCLTVALLTGCAPPKGPDYMHWGEGKPISFVDPGPTVPADMMALASTIAHRIPGMIDNNFRDGASARFRNVRARYLLIDNGIRKVEFCGQVNAKNAFGALTGWSTFFVGGPANMIGGFSIDSDAYSMNCNGPGTEIEGDWAKWFQMNPPSDPAPAADRTRPSATRRR